MPHLLPAAASAVAAAAPAAAAGAAKAGVMATLKSVAFKAVTNLAISAALSALQPQVGGQGGRTFEWTIDPDAPIPFAAGQVGVAGSVVHRDTFGPDLMYYGIPAVLSGAGPITGYDSVRADDYLVTFDATGRAITSTYAGELWFKSTLGNQPDVALSSPTGLKNGAALPGWTTAHKLSGKAAYMVVMGENSKGSAFPTGEIKPLITFRGLKGWDPRLDSTYPGGSGSCRLDNPATWVYLTNPILWALKWSLGLWEGPTGKGAPQVDHQVGGIGAKLSGIDVPAFVAAANIADANNWTVSAYPNTDDDKHQVLEAFLQAGGAIYSQRAGKISCIQRAAPRTSIVTISAADTAGPLEIDTAASRIERINTIRPRFWSPAHRWQMTAMDEVTAASYQTEDGGKRTRGIDYPFVSNAKQAGQLAALQIANTREGIAGVIPLKPHLQRIRPGDAFTITEAGFVLNGLKCLCLNTDYEPATGVVRVSFVSETDAKYPFALGQDPTPPEPQVLTPVDPGYVTPPQIGDWTIVPRPPAPGGQLPGFDLGGIVSNETATSIIVEHGPTDEGPWKQAYEGPPTVTSIPIDGLQPGATYYIAIQYRRDNNYSARSVYGPYVAPALIGDVMPDAPGLDQIKGDIEEAFGDLLDLDNELAQARLDLDAQEAEIVAARGGQANLSARIAQVNQARIDGDEAIATTVSGVEARTDQTEADIIDLEIAQAGETSARAAAIEVIEARSAPIANLLENGNFAQGFGGVWFQDGGPNSATYVDQQFGPFAYVDDYIASKAYPVSPGAQVAVSWSGFQTGADANIYIQALPSGDVVARALCAPGSYWNTRNRSTLSTPMPAGAYAWRAVVDPGTAAVYCSSIKVNGGSTATDWSDEASGMELSASVTEQSLAIIDLENQQALASWQVVANAAGGKPARIGLTSSTLGSFIALDAPYIFWGDNTVFDDATDTLQTTVGGHRRILALGAPFGQAANLIEWWGPSDIAIGSMTTVNGLNGRMTTAPFVFDHTIPIPLQATATPRFRTLNVPNGSGTYQVGTITVAAQNATAAVSVAWTRLFGHTGFTATAPSSATTNFQATVSPGLIYEAIFEWVMTEVGTGRTASGIVRVSIVTESGS